MSDHTSDHISDRTSPRDDPAQTARKWQIRAEALSAALGKEASQRDRSRTLAHDEFAALSASGVLAVTLPVTHGGDALNTVALANIIVTLAKGDSNIAQALQPHFCGIEKLRIYGTQAQRAHHFAAVADGALLTNAAAEKHTAVVGDVSTTLTRDRQNDRGYRLSGTKAYSTGSLFARHLYILSNAEDGKRAIAWVPVAREGLTILDDWDAMGQRTTASGTTRLDDVFVDPEEIMWLPAPGSRRTYEGAFAQVLHAAIDAGIALAALDDAVIFCRDHARPVPEAGVSRASEDPYALHAVGEMATLAHGAVAMVERAARILDDAISAFFTYGIATSTPEQAWVERLLAQASVAVAEAKITSSDAALRVSEMLFRVGGASATTSQRNLDRHWRNARTHTTHDPVAYKARAIGDFYLNGRFPPVTTKI